MTMISPTNKEVQIGQTLKDDEFIGMVRHLALGVTWNPCKHLVEFGAGIPFCGVGFIFIMCFGDLWRSLEYPNRLC